MSHDEINVTGTVSAGGSIVLKLLNGYSPANGDTLSLMSFGSFANSGYVFDFSQAGLPVGLGWDTTTFAATGNVGVVLIPEPGMLALLGIASLSLLACAWRRKAI